MCVIVKKYNRDDARACQKSVRYADRFYLLREHTPPLPNDDNDAREGTHQSEKLPLAY